MIPLFYWTYEPENRRYVIWRGDWVYQRLPIDRHNPANTERYAQRCCDILNGRNL